MRNDRARTFGALALMLGFVLLSGALIVVFWQDPQRDGGGALSIHSGPGVYAPCGGEESTTAACWDKAARDLTLGLVTVDRDDRGHGIPGVGDGQGILGASRSSDDQPFLPSYRVFPAEGQHCRVQGNLRERALEVLPLDGEGHPVLLCAEARSLLVRLPR